MMIPCLCLMFCCLFPDMSLASDSESVDTTIDDRFILTFFGGRRVPHHRFGHQGNDWHQNHEHGPTADRLTHESSETATHSPLTARRHLGLKRMLLGKFSFSLVLTDGRRVDEVGGSRRMEPIGRLSEYVVRVPNASLADVSGLIVSLRTNSTKRFVRMTKVWLMQFYPRLQKAQFNVPDNSPSDILTPDSEFLMYRACKMLNKDADHQLIRMYKGSGYLCEDVSIQDVIHEDEEQDWQQLLGDATHSHTETSTSGAV